MQSTAERQLAFALKDAHRREKWLLLGSGRPKESG